MIYWIHYTRNISIYKEVHGLGFHGSQLTVGSLTPRRKSSVGLGTRTRTVGGNSENEQFLTKSQI